MTGKNKSDMFGHPWTGGQGGRVNNIPIARQGVRGGGGAVAGQVRNCVCRYANVFYCKMFRKEDEKDLLYVQV